MKTFKGFSVGLVLGLSIALASIAFAQNTTQTDPNKKSDCCCVAMDCCKSDSCPMMKDNAAKDGTAKSEKHACCSGDSCNMKDSKHMNHMKTKDMKNNKSNP